MCGDGLGSVAMEVGDGAVSLGKVLPRGSSGAALVWSGGMHAFGTSAVYVRGRACGFPAAGHMKKGNGAEG